MQNLTHTQHNHTHACTQHTPASREHSHSHAQTIEQGIVSIPIIPGLSSKYVTMIENTRAVTIPEKERKICKNCNNCRNRF